MQQESSSDSFSYNLQNISFIKQETYCRAIALNNDNSILLTGNISIINVYQFKQGRLKLIQNLNKHKKGITTLNFIKSGYFFSGSDDSQIIMWQKYLINQTKYIQKLKNHSNSILCLILNYNENLLVSSSYDFSIKFWNLPFYNLKQWKLMQTITEHTQPVYGLSMNKEQNQIISCGYDSLILVIEYEKCQSLWIIKQKINVDQWGYRVCFINTHIFTFQPCLSTQLYIYILDQMSQQYRIHQKLPVKGGGQFCSSLFPSIFNHNNNIILIKNGSHINLIKFIAKQNNQKNEEYFFKLEQSINCKVDYYGIGNIFGTLSQDGNYLITWDAYSQQILIREYKNL
ncbi:unnamed protein product [Paramecium sonneborni]|uniref:WD40-repeat-containing domain n=1 Tax=Paramecium sonneborni TaxID=65129 RepID=A0A8S1RAJ2_9CILI|nr:unnamed protein product [Paramecium sonneborni]